MKKRLSPDSLGARLYKNRHFYVLMLPFFLIFFVFTVWPVLMTIGLSFTSYNVFEAPKSWAGTIISTCLSTTTFSASP